MNLATAPRPPAALAPRTFPWVGVVGPVALSLVLFLVVRSPYVLIGAVMGPALVFAGWWDSRRRDVRDHARRDGEYRRSLAAWNVALEDSDTREVAERHRSHPSIVDALAQTDWTPGLRRTSVIRLGTVIEASSVTGRHRRVPWCEDVGGGIAIVGEGEASRQLWRAAECAIVANFGVPISDGRGAQRDALTTLLWEGAIRLTRNPHDSADLIIRCSGAQVLSVYRRGEIPHEGTWRPDPVTDVHCDALSDRCASVEGPIQSWDDRPASGSGIAYDSAGDMCIALDETDPHALIAGRTGGGKSEILVALVAALAAECEPESWGCIIFDFKGGATARRLEMLPHVWGTATDLDLGAAQALLSLVSAEVVRRERVLESERVALMSETTWPERVAIVIDEFQAFSAQLPGAADIITDIARRGRSLGLNLVLSTQNPAGVVRDALNSNITTRICGPMVSAHDVSYVLGVSGVAMPAVGQVVMRTANGVVRHGTVRRVDSGALDTIAARYRGHKNRCPVPKNEAP